jgi:hypothetical protein
MSFQAHDAVGPDDRVVPRPGWKIEAVSYVEVHGFAPIRKPEADRACLHDEHLVVAVLMGRVPIARPV